MKRWPLTIVVLVAQAVLGGATLFYLFSDQGRLLECLVSPRLFALSVWSAFTFCFVSACWVVPSLFAEFGGLNECSREFVSSKGWTAVARLLRSVPLSLVVGEVLLVLALIWGLWLCLSA